MTSSFHVPTWFLSSVKRSYLLNFYALIQVHLELLYYPFGTDKNLYTNPFDPDYTLTSVEKALQTAPYGSEDSDSGKPSSPQKRDVIVRGVLSVTVIGAEELPSVDFMGKADPYVVLVMKKSETKVKTRVRFSQFCSLSF